MKKIVQILGGLLCSLLFASMSIAGPANTNAAVWVKTSGVPIAGVHDDGGIFASYFVGDIVGSVSPTTITITSTLSTNVLYFGSGGTLTNSTHKP